MNTALTLAALAAGLVLTVTFAMLLDDERARKTPTPARPMGYRPVTVNVDDEPEAQVLAALRQTAGLCEEESSGAEP